MLNKELLMMVGGKSLGSKLSIYISPDISKTPSVSGMLSSGKSFSVSNPGETTLKFSELDLTAIITVRYIEGVELSVSNLLPAYAAYSGGDVRAPIVMMDSFRIANREQSASISLT